MRIARDLIKTGRRRAHAIAPRRLNTRPLSRLAPLRAKLRDQQSKRCDCANRRKAPANGCLTSTGRSRWYGPSARGTSPSTVDGMRFRVPVRSIHTGPNPRYFARGRGVTWLNYMTDQFAGLHAIVIPGTLRDSLMILDGLLEIQSPSEGGPSVIITHQAAYSDQVFGLFWLLGYQFSPRPAGLPDQRFWRIDPNADYGSLGGLARHRVNTRRGG